MLDDAIEILDEQGPCLVVNKPPGLLTQAPPGIDSLERRVKAFLERRDAMADEVYLGVPHRLDRPASGAIVLATHRRAARRLAEQFERRLVRKVYWACVSGEVTPTEGTWRDFLRKVPDQPRAEVVPADHPDAREAVLHYRTLGRFAWGTWLEIVLETGRMHQVRVQGAVRGHPVLGDAMYGSPVAFGPQHDDWRLRAIALHARELTFRHPATHREVCVFAPLPNVWGDLVKNAG
ncbi:MAG: RNA pseudouridine synthase [Thermoguttaceae bacterium]|jgi:23S rRNA pseudouridine1911/1915/1917 synthase|nr:RNA pseudouridine synthase [Thermoguttaceae bacterium]